MSDIIQQYHTYIFLNNKIKINLFCIHFLTHKNVTDKIQEHKIYDNCMYVLNEFTFV